MSNVPPPLLRNRWYQFGWSEELDRGGTLARTVLGEDVVLYRDAEGGVAALHDRCPHRFAPLSGGRVEGGTLACPYHGLAFDGAGRCVLNPHGAAVRALDVRAYVAVERHDVLWIWMGDANAADPAIIPPLHFIEETRETARILLHTHVRANYELLSDNIMDLSHSDYLHAGTLGSGFNTRVRARITEHDDHLTIAWRSDSDEAPPIFRIASPAKLWTVVDWYAPAVMVLRAGGHPVDDPDGGIDTLNLHSMTPETEETSHYFACNTRSFMVDDANFKEALRAQILHAFQVEDKPMIEQVQQRMRTTDLWALNPALLAIDAGAVQARRRLGALIEQEQRQATLAA